MIAQAFHRAGKKTRMDLYKVPFDDQLPQYLFLDAYVPFMGFVGEDYSEGGLALLAINPGGGGSAYQQRAFGDDELIPAIQRFVLSDPAIAPSAFKTMSKAYARQLTTWNLWRIVQPTLEASGRTLDQIAFLNWFPYRTAENKMPRAHAMSRAQELVIEPLLAALAPSAIAALGKKVGGYAERYLSGSSRVFVVPRTNGDSYVCPEARHALSELGRFFERQRSLR